MVPVSGNRLLQALAPDDLAVIEPLLQPVQLDLRQQLELPRKPIAHAFFPESGIASAVARSKSGQKVEAGMIGREGMTGLAVVLSNTKSSEECYIQVAGEGQQIASDDLRGVMAQRSSIQHLFLRYAKVFMSQTAHTALANGRGSLEQRLARWLLMAHDRIGGDELPLKHEFLSLMLGVRRAGVTTALHELEAVGLISGRRGCVIVKDRDGLEDTAEGFYGIPEAEYEREVVGL